MAERQATEGDTLWSEAGCRNVIRDRALVAQRPGELLQVAAVFRIQDDLHRLPPRVQAPVRRDEAGPVRGTLAEGAEEAPVVLIPDLRLRHERVLPRRDQPHSPRTCLLVDAVNRAP